MKHILIPIFLFLTVFVSGQFSPIDTVFRGTAPGDGTGDPARTAFSKVNKAIINLNDSCGTAGRLRVINNTGSVVAENKVVLITGNSGEIRKFGWANAKYDSTSIGVLGVTDQVFYVGDTGRVILWGEKRGINTIGMTPGDQIWLDSTNGGYINHTMPTPYRQVLVGQVGRMDATEGSINVQFMDLRLGQYVDVPGGTMYNNLIVYYDSIAGEWAGDILEELPDTIFTTPADLSSAPDNVVLYEDGDTISYSTDFTFLNKVLNLNDVLKLNPTSTPTTPVEGMIYQNSTDHHLYVYNGTSWVQLDN